MDDGLGLIITDDHEATINSLAELPVAFGAADDSDLPDEWSSPIEAWHQGSTSSCAGHAGAANFTHRQWVETGELIRYSPWYCYLQSQRRGGFFGRDQGTSIKSVIDSATLDGACLESLCLRPERYSTKISEQAIADAVRHKHHGKPIDLREWQRMIDWLTDRRSVVIGTKWMSGQSSFKGIETKAIGSSGSFRGYHARALIGYEKARGEILPNCLNSHGRQWANNGRALLEHELWDWWLRDPNFVALGFTDIDERTPARRDWSQSRAGDSC
jgi:hypothetical protein